MISRIANEYESENDEVLREFAAAMRQAHADAEAWERARSERIAEAERYAKQRRRYDSIAAALLWGILAVLASALIGIGVAIGRMF